MAGPAREFWQQRFASHDMPWDRGAPSGQLLQWLADGTLKPCRILVPGCGSGHEVLALAQAGFEVTGVDYTPAALEQCRARLEQGGAQAELIEADVLAWSPARPFDAIYEQTCLCALHPEHWRRYGDQLARWTVPGGRLFMLLIQVARPGAANGIIEGPPYHCDINGTRALFGTPDWNWPAPPYPRMTHSSGAAELALILERTAPRPDPA